MLVLFMTYHLKPFRDPTICKLRLLGYAPASNFRQRSVCQRTNQRFTAIGQFQMGGRRAFEFDLTNLMHGKLAIALSGAIYNLYRRLFGQCRA